MEARATVTRGIPRRLPNAAGPTGPDRDKFTWQEQQKVRRIMDRNRELDGVSTMPDIYPTDQLLILMFTVQQVSHRTLQANGWFARNLFFDKQDREQRLFYITERKGAKTCVSYMGVRFRQVTQISEQACVVQCIDYCNYFIDSWGTTGFSKMQAKTY